MKKAGLNVVTGQDFDKSCVATMEANHRPVIPGDIRKIDPANVLEMAKISRGGAFLVCGGPPCQPFSTAGKRLGINDPRGSLFMDYIRMIDYIRPRFFVMENVKGIMSAPLRTDTNEISGHPEQPAKLLHNKNNELQKTESAFCGSFYVNIYCTRTFSHPPVCHPHV